MRSSQRFSSSFIPRDRDELDLSELKAGALHRLKVKLAEDAASNDVRVPVIVARGVEPGPVVGITAAIHGNEVNGIPTIHRLFQTVDPKALKGTIVAVPVLNLPGFLANRREFRDGKDLNRAFPGDADGVESEVYAYNAMERIIRHFAYLFDLHTASFGRINSLYVRADMKNPVVAELSRVLRPQIIVHNTGGDGTLRGAAQARGIAAVTIEIGNPQRIQTQMVESSSIGLRDVLEHLGMVPADGEAGGPPAVECRRSFWLYTDGGGLLHVFPEPFDRVAKGQRVAELLNEWGDVYRTYDAPEDAVVVGKSTNPVAHSGSRIVHLGIVGQP